MSPVTFGHLENPDYLRVFVNDVFHSRLLTPTACSAVGFGLKHHEMFATSGREVEGSLCETSFGL